jgi:hypothetical protein
MHSETALALVTRKHVNRRERRAADPDRTREFCLSQGGILSNLFPCYSPVTVGRDPLFERNSWRVRSAANAVSQRFSLLAALGCFAAGADRLLSQVKNIDELSFL